MSRTAHSTSNAGGPASPSAPSAMERFRAVFHGLDRGVVIGMIHVRALPGTAGNCTTVAEAAAHAVSEARVYVEGGVDAIELENMHDTPYLNGSVGPEITAAMAAVCAAVRAAVPASIPVGVQILAAANREAMAVAHAAGLQFIRAEGFVFAHVADEGTINSCAGDLLRYRRAIGAGGVLVFADIKKKHSSHAITADVSIEETAHAAEFFRTDGVIVTGASTGATASSAELASVRRTVPTVPVLVGSGVTVDNLEDYIDAAALVVGSHFKEGGHWSGRVDIDRVRALCTKAKRLRSRKPASAL